jgi:hypothetical protein
LGANNLLQLDKEFSTSNPLGLTVLVLQRA